MADIILNLRHYEYKRYLTELRGAIPDNAYAVALVKTPPFPGNKEFHHPESSPLAVVCAAMYSITEGQRSGEKLWGWICLGPQSKDEIGKDLLDAGAEVGRWHYLVLSSEAE